MAKTKSKTINYTAKGNKYRGPKKVSKTKVTDNSQLTAKQQYKLAKQRLYNQSAEARAKQTTIRAVAANASQAITGATGSIISGQMQSEMTKRARIESAAKQATQGGLTSSDTSRDDDDEEEEKDKGSRWAYGKKR